MTVLRSIRIALLAAAPLVGVGTQRPIQESSAEYGERAVKLLVERVTAQVKDRLEDPQAYYGHGLRL